MKNKSSLTLMLAGALALSTGLAHATDDFAQGELSLVFYALTGDAPGVFSSEYYVVNLGPVSSFRANTQNNVPVKTVNPSIFSSNVAEDLATVFGADWAEDGTVHMMAVTTVSQGLPTVTGDPSRTFYLSSKRTSLNTDQKGFDPDTTFVPTTISSSNRIKISNQITGFLYDTGVNKTITENNPTSGVNKSGVRLTTSQSNNLSNYLPSPDYSLYFEQAMDPGAILGEGKLPGTANVEAAVDIFRVIHTPNEATLTSGSSSGNAVVGQRQFIGAITLDSAGELKVQAVGIAAPPTGGYDSWATTNNVTGGTTGDSDNDGISNLTEYALALNPAASDGAAGTYANGTVSFTKRPEAVTNNDVTYAIQESDDLGVTDAWETVTATTNTTSQISYTLPAGSAKKFARLLVTKVP